MIRNLVALSVVTAGLALLGGCSDKSQPGSWPDGTVAPDGRIFFDFIAQDVGIAPDLGGDKDGPIIEMVTPKEGQEVTGTTLKVQAKITDSDVVDDQSVQVTLKGQKPTKMSLSSTPSVYEALIDISNITAGAMLWVEAWDLKGKKSAKVVLFTRDPGPVIVISSPGEGSRHRTSVSIQVLVFDLKKNIASFETRIGTTTLNLQKTTDEGKKQIWSGSIKFDDPMFPQILTGAQAISATAANAGGATNTATRNFVVDTDGPTIVCNSHKAGDMVGGIITLKATVTDSAGVLPSSVIAVIGNKLDTREVTLVQVSGSSDQYQAKFDTHTLTQYDLWPVMSFRAADSLGNESHTDIQVGLDNGAPIVELSGGSVYYMQKKDAAYECSVPFDPVGVDSAHDQQLVPPIAYLRARVEDQGNDAQSAPWIPIVGNDESTVKLYVLDDTTRALFVDTDGDGFCDNVNPEIDPAASTPQPYAAVAVDLMAVPVGGKAFFPLTYKGPGICVAGTEDPTKPPDPLCPVTPLIVALQYTADAAPALFAIPPVVSGNTYKCIGIPFDFKVNGFQKGWACAGAVARDKLQNRGVSPPIRPWHDPANTTVGPQALPAEATSPPDCTGTLDKTTGKVDSGKPCKYRAAGTSFPQKFPQMMGRILK
jgi:hypothetical protein